MESTLHRPGLGWAEDALRVALLAGVLLALQAVLPSWDVPAVGLSSARAQCIDEAIQDG